MERNAVIVFFAENKALIFAALFAMSEVLAEVPSIKSNSVFQLVYNVLKGGKNADRDNPKPN